MAKKKWILRAVSFLAALGMGFGATACEGLLGTTSSSSSSSTSSSSTGGNGGQTQQQQSNLQFILNADGESYSVGVFNSLADYERFEEDIISDNGEMVQFEEFVAKTSFPAEYIIPSEYQGKPVTKILDYGFAYANFVFLTIPASIQEIGDFAFIGCLALVRVTVGKGVTKLGQNWLTGWDSPLIQEIYNLSSVKMSAISSDFGEVQIHTSLDAPSCLERTADGFLLRKFTEAGEEYLAVVGYLGTRENIEVPVGNNKEYVDFVFLVQNYNVKNVTISGVAERTLLGLYLNLESITVDAQAGCLSLAQTALTPKLKGVYFENPNDWYTDEARTQAVDPAILSNPESVLEYLKSGDVYLYHASYYDKYK